MGVSVSRILHAGYLFECEGTQIVFDPIFENPFSRNCYAFPSVRFDADEIRKQRFDAVLISHFHDDHCSMESLDLIHRDTPIYMYCLFEEMFELIKELGFTNVLPLAIDSPVRIGAFEIIPRRALDWDVDSMFQIQAEGLNILNVVDSWIDSTTLAQLAQGASWDLVLWPFQTMLETDVLSPSRAPKPSLEIPSEWVDQLKELSPRFVVPSSCQFVQEPWSWHNQALFPISYHQFQKEIEAQLPETQVVRLNPSVTVVLEKGSLSFSESLPWVIPVGEQDVDYKFNPEIKPPSTAEVAKHFPALSENKREKVLRYCQSGLLEKYQSLESSQEPYFEKTRIWQLSLYDHQGEAFHFFYRLQPGKIEHISPELARVSKREWLTEVPIFKLHAALESGEALTSMYIRINDVKFSEDVEQEIETADLVEDPLIRCLFHGSFGAYQIAQLKRLKLR